MPRLRRLIQPGQFCHLTHRCHNQAQLLRFAQDRRVYRWWLWEAVRRYNVPLLAWAITRNHVHLIVQALTEGSISQLMQLASGRVAQQYNRRKGRSGSFWGGRFHVTLIESGLHLWRCLVYVELNMVRAGVVRHPEDWPWCSYAELRQGRRRHRIVSLPVLLAATNCSDPATLWRLQEQAIADELQARDLRRQPIWTESMAVGSEEFVRNVAARTAPRRLTGTEPLLAEREHSVWVLRERMTVYGDS